MFSKIFIIPSLLATFLYHTTYASLIRDVSTPNLQVSYRTLQQWYNSSNGLWIPSTGWWNSANCLTVIVKLASADTSLQPQIQDVITKTFYTAPLYDPDMFKVMGAENNLYLPQTFYGDYPPYPPAGFLQLFGAPQRYAFTGFLNDYYDDEGWWALAWIAAYDLTKNLLYLTQAQSIFADMKSVFGQTNCSKNSGGVGGIWWDKQHTYVNAIANELFFSVAASLANRAVFASERASYLAIAKQQWAWFQGSGMLGSNSTINDGLDQKSCQNNRATIWSYNQGVVLGGLVEFSKATKDNSYLDTAHSIASAAIATLAPFGILKDPCEPSCGADGAQFKGIFVRNLLVLHQADPRDAYKNFIIRNANSIWNYDRNSKNELSVSWGGPLYTTDASTHSSAMDCLVAAAVVR